jgi:hypothetical protein
VILMKNLAGALMGAALTAWSGLRRHDQFSRVTLPVLHRDRIVRSALGPRTSAAVGDNCR